MNTLTNKNDNNQTVKSIPFRIKKRGNQFENEVIHLKKNLIHIPNSYGDRFIPRRYVGIHNKTHIIKQRNTIDDSFGGDFLQSHSQYFSATATTNNNNSYQKSQQIDILTNKSDGDWRTDAFKRTINNVFQLEKNNRRLLIFHDVLTQEICRRTMKCSPTIDYHEQYYKNVNNLDWQCTRRQRPMAYADSTHDLPGFHRFSQLNVIAWSKTGKVAASFGLDLVLWLPDADNTSVYKIKGIRALCYNQSGTLLAIGSKKVFMNCLNVWDVQNDAIHVKNFYCYIAMNDEVRCIEFDRNDTFILCGMLTGLIYVHHYPSLRIKKTLTAHSAQITTIQFSANHTYMATVDIRGKLVVWLLATFTIYFEWQATDYNRVHIAWHPWTEPDLILATMSPATINLMNVQSFKMDAYYRRSDTKCIIDAISFNRISGELVVSCYCENIELDNALTNKILVMSSINKVDEVLWGHEDRVHHLMWNQDHTQLGTAGDDETLHIWNFFALPFTMLRQQQQQQFKIDKQLRQQSTFKLNAYRTSQYRSSSTTINDKHLKNRNKLSLFGSFLHTSR